jgi:sugar/nucleoside kinase (ribokinase family)
MLYAAKGLKALKPLLERAHIVFMNLEEVECLTGKDFKGGARELIKSGCRIVVVTLGKGLPRGKTGRITAYIRSGEKEYEV